MLRTLSLITRTPKVAAMWAVASVEALSTTITSPCSPLVSSHREREARTVGR
ncbi:hypothetical protein OOK12_24990 [Streptomyces sp. NBC_00452]|uniref:hypothetical protein n=1 Tax=Streptomyces sp. NBC_00452 TaxID=2975746 RepID=UPI0022526EEF|nr:hypothetical protein [Streptomyces sp. NBC_00452]MCX5060219.1 hypothetical protein [Streptomyces sp. NBC_00452]